MFAALAACMLSIPSAAARQLSAASSVDPDYVELTQTLEQRAFTLQNYAQQGAAAAAQRAGSATAALRVGPAPGVAPEETTVTSPNLQTTEATQRTAVAANSTATLCGNGVCDAGESCSNWCVAAERRLVLQSNNPHTLLCIRVVYRCTAASLFS